MVADLAQKHQRIIDSPINPECYLTIVIPVRNEAEHLTKTLKSLTFQKDSKNRPIKPETFEIIFLVNNSTDDSKEIIQNWCRRHPSTKIYFAEVSLEPENSNIGYVRRWLMNEAYLRLTGNNFNGGIIATTDGDTEIAPNWISATVSEIKKGVGAVGGRILINHADLRDMNFRTRSFHLRDTGYRLMAVELESFADYLEHDSFPRHHQHFNGSFAVTTEAFEKAGGVPDVKFLEDVAFYRSLHKNDVPFRHSPAVRVRTSARLEGRTELGLSTQMNEWTIMGENGDRYLVESAFSMVSRFQARKEMRDLWKNESGTERFDEDKIKRLADKLLIDYKYLTDQLKTVQTFGNLYENIIGEQKHRINWQTENPLICIERAIFDLRLILEKIRRGKDFANRIV